MRVVAALAVGTAFTLAGLAIAGVELDGWRGILGMAFIFAGGGLHAQIRGSS